MRWRDKADFYIVFTREAHANARGAERLGQAADQLIAQDADGDNAVSLAEFKGPIEMFEPFDIDNDGVVRSHELLAARKISQFDAIEEPTTAEQRLALARRFRAEVPGAIPVLLDELDNRTSDAYGGAPNSMFVIAPDGTISHEFDWASTRDAEQALTDLFGQDLAKAKPETEPQIDWTLIETELAAARAANHEVLLQFTAPGCGACAAMESKTLADPQVGAGVRGYQHVTLGVERDDAWGLFEALELDATPAFVILDPATLEVLRVSQGFSEREQFLGFLAGDESPDPP